MKQNSEFRGLEECSALAAPDLSKFHMRYSVLVVFFFTHANLKRGEKMSERLIKTSYGNGSGVKYQMSSGGFNIPRSKLDSEWMELVSKYASCKYQLDSDLSIRIEQMIDCVGSGVSPGVIGSAVITVRGLLKDY